MALVHVMLAYGLLALSGPLTSPLRTGLFDGPVALVHVMLAYGLLALSGPFTSPP